MNAHRPADYSGGHGPSRQGRARVVLHYHRGRERAEALSRVAAVGADLADESEVEFLFTRARGTRNGEVCAAGPGASDELSGHVTGEVVTVAGGTEGRTVHA